MRVSCQIYWAYLLDHVVILLESQGLKVESVDTDKRIVTGDIDPKRVGELWRVRGLLIMWEQ